eukprot:Opistho-2@22572
MKKTNQKSSASSGNAKDRQSSGGKSKRGGPRGDSAVPDVDNIINVWPEWNDNDILAEKWAEKDKSGKHIALFDDPEGLIELPRSVKGGVATWRRPSEYITDQTPIVVDPQRYDSSAWTSAAPLATLLGTSLAGTAAPFVVVQQPSVVLLHQFLTGEKAMEAAAAAAAAAPEGDAQGKSEGLDDIARIATGQNSSANSSELMRTIASQLSIILDGRLGVGTERFRPWELIYPRGKDGVPTYNAGGKYSVRLYWLGAWRRITIDDRMPFDSEGSILLPTSTATNELWVPILSKALLRLAALSYQDGPSEPEHGDFCIMHALTGSLPESIPMHATTAQKGDLWTVLCDAWRPIDSREDGGVGDDDDRSNSESRPDTPPNEEGIVTRQPSQSQAGAHRTSQGSAGQAHSARVQSGQTQPGRMSNANNVPSTTLRKQTSVSSVTAGPHSAGASKVVPGVSSATSGYQPIDVVDPDAIAYDRLVLATFAPFRPSFPTIGSPSISAIAALASGGAVQGGSGLASMSNQSGMIGPHGSVVTQSSLNLPQAPVTSLPHPAEVMWSRADHSHTALVYEMRTVSVSQAAATTLRTSADSDTDAPEPHTIKVDKVDLHLVWIVSPFTHWKGRLSYTDTVGWSPELETAVGLSREARLNRQKSLSALRDAGKSHAPFEFWMVFEDFLEHMRCLSFIHHPSSFDQSESVVYVHESIVTGADSSPNAASLAFRIPLLLHVESETPIEVLIGFTAFSGPKANAPAFGLGPPSGMLVVDKYNWQNSRSDAAVFKIKTNATRAAVLSVPAGTHVYRLSVMAPFGYWVNLCSRHAFTFGEEGYVLRERLGAFVSDYEGTHDEQAANGWFLLFQQAFNFSQPTFVRATLYSPLQFSGPRLDDAITSHSQLRIIDNDTLKEVPKVFLQPTPKLLEPNSRGYTFMGDGRCPQAIMPGRWRLRIISSPAPPIPLLPEIATKFSSLDFDGAYVHNKHSTLFRFTVRIDADHPVTIQLGTSQPSVYIKLQILDNNEEVASATGRSHALIPAFLFQSDPRADSRADADVAPPAKESSAKESSAKESSAKERETKESKEREREREREREKQASATTSMSALNLDTTNDGDSDSIISENIREYKPHKYIIQATIERKSWPIPGLVRSLSIWDNGQGGMGAVPMTPSKEGKEGLGASGGVGPDKKLSVSGAPSSERATGRARAKSAARAGSPFKVPDIPAYSENDLVWRLRIMSVVDTSKLDVKKDTEREDQIKAIKSAWETSQPGRAVKARTSREQYLAQLCEKDPAKLAEMSDEVSSADRGHGKHDTLDKYLRKSAQGHVPRVLCPAEERTRTRRELLLLRNTSRSATPSRRRETQTGNSATNSKSLLLMLLSCT